MPRLLLKNKGFSLIELVISVGILSVGILTVIQALSSAARATGLSCDIIEAVFLAEDQMQQLEFKEKESLLNIEPKETSSSKDKFQWKYDLSLDPDLKLYKLNLSVSWNRLNRREAVTLITYLK